MSVETRVSHEGWGSKLLRGSTWLWLQQAADMGMVVVFTSLALRGLGPQGFGSVVLVQSILNLVGLGTFNLEIAAIRLVPYFREQSLWRTNRMLVRSVWFVKLCLSVVVTCLLFFLAPWIAGIYHNAELVTALRVGCLSLFSAMFANVGAALSPCRICSRSCVPG